MSVGLALGVLAGAHAATWGAYKDSPYEGFHPARGLRSVVLAVVVACAMAGSGVLGQSSGVVACGVVYTGERLATEWWKTIVRENDQAAYSIPMRLGCFGRPVNRRGVRYLVGLAIGLGCVATGVGIHVAQQVVPPMPWWLLVVVVGGAGGWLTACGGAWKDAPIEGFSGWKFLRSPVVATAWAIPLSALTDSWVVLLLAAGGLAVASIETYKTFLTGGRPPGKFATRPVRYVLPRTRRWIGFAHAGTWAVAAGALELAWVRRMVAADGLHPLRVSGWGFAADQLVVMVAVAMAALAARSNTTLKHSALPGSESLDGASEAVPL